MAVVIVSMQRYAFQEVEYEVADDIVEKAMNGDEDARQAVRDAGITAMEKANPEYQWDSTHWVRQDGEEIDSH